MFCVKMGNFRGVLKNLHVRVVCKELTQLDLGIPNAHPVQPGSIPLLQGHRLKPPVHSVPLDLLVQQG